MKIAALAFLGGFIFGGGASLCLLSGENHFAMGLQRFAEASRLRVMSGFGRKGAKAVESTEIDPAIVYGDTADQELIARMHLTGADRERLEAIIKRGQF